jgi:hypothetical protein
MFYKSYCGIFAQSKNCGSGEVAEIGSSHNPRKWMVLFSTGSYRKKRLNYK